MNLINIFNEIEKADPEIYERVSMRRDIIKNWSKKVALTALPFALGSLFNKAYGKTTDSVTDVLNFALTLEYLEAKFYATGVAATGLIPGTGLDKANLMQIAADEAAHVSFLKTTLLSLGATPVAEPNFDYTAKGAFNDVFTNYTTFLAVAQAFEDTGVRAYKGQAGNLTTNPDVLTAALRIHSVEGRHAAQIHLLRNVRPWIPLNQSQLTGGAAQATYNGEENTLQADIELTSISGTSAMLASEDFDEPLTKQQVLDIVTPFLA